MSTALGGGWRTHVRQGVAKKKHTVLLQATPRHAGACHSPPRAVRINGIHSTKLLFSDAKKKAVTPTSGPAKIENFCG